VADAPRIRERGGEIALDVRLVPGSSKEEIVGWDESGRLRVRVRARPVEGAANDALLSLLAGTLGVSRGKLAITRGETSREKTVSAKGVTLAAAGRALSGTGVTKKNRA
jgi:uncharacterized protein (TIGR00251 family)